jgi:hypothetical protein
MATEEDLNAVRETIRKAAKDMDQAPWGTGKTMAEDSHCLAGWAFKMAQEQKPPPTRRQQIKSKMRTVRYNAYIVRTVIRHPLSYHCLDSGEGW